MIASLVATLDHEISDLSATISQIASLPCVEIGDVTTSSCRLALVIDSSDPDSLEIITQRLQQVPGVVFVDVVFVHFEDNS